MDPGHAPQEHDRPRGQGKRRPRGHSRYLRQNNSRGHSQGYHRPHDPSVVVGSDQGSQQTVGPSQKSYISRILEGSDPIPSHESPAPSCSQGSRNLPARPQDFSADLNYNEPVEPKNKQYQFHAVRRQQKHRDGKENDESRSSRPERGTSNRRGYFRSRGRPANLRYSNQIAGEDTDLKLGESDQNSDLKHMETKTKLSFDENSSKDTANVQSEISEHHLKSNNFECMICCDIIHRSNSIWYCSNCYNIFHLKCSIEWCNKSIKSRDEAIANAQYPSLSQDFRNTSRASTSGNVELLDGNSNYQSERLKSIEWPCPTCREVLHTRPNKYLCFCGKVEKPDLNRLLTPHSCGRICGRKRPNAECPHTCNSLCHPGRCAPCSLTSRKRCFCGKTTKEVKCSAGTISCGQICAKLLPCGSHYCSKLCHTGSCGSCDEILTISCNCGLQEINLQCDEAGKRISKRFSCEKVCGRLLACKKHYCNEKCHPGPSCLSCKLLSENIKTCPCGSTLIKKSLLTDRKSCTDPIPTCENKCNRPLICGTEKNRHKCQKKCHTGACPPCKLKTTAYCECKLSTKTIDCSMMYEKVENGGLIHFKQIEHTFTCQTRCNTLKNCGRHRCFDKCCKFIKNSQALVHKCNQKCNRKLPCGIHHCTETCHLGQCGDCTNIGWEELTCHCGASILYPPIPCGARPPVCHRLCRRAHSCGHPVKHECHDDTEKCAPCTVFVKKSCFCGSDSKDSVYCYLPGYSCGRTCKKQLSCKQHTCKRVCHEGECETPNKRGVIFCDQPCPVTRYSCKHPCGVPCHANTQCPTTDCKKIMEITCECGNKKDRMECYKVMRDADNINKVAMLSTNRSNEDSIIIDLSKKPQVKKENQNCNLKKLDCDETCSILRRNKALAEALDIAQPDLKPTNVFGEDPLRLLKEATAQDYKFVAATFNSLTRFIKSAKESDKRFIFMHLPPASKLRREVVHELAYHFNCTSESREEEPFRHVVVRAYKNKSSVPDFNIEQLLPVSS